MTDKDPMTVGQLRAMLYCCCDHDEVHVVLSDKAGECKPIVDAVIHDDEEAIYLHVDACDLEG